MVGSSVVIHSVDLLSALAVAGEGSPVDDVNEH